MIHYCDIGPAVTVRDIVEAVGDAIDADASDDQICDILDEKFIDSVSPYLKNRKLLADIRGVIVSAYRLGRARGLKLEIG